MYVEHPEYSDILVNLDTHRLVYSNDGGMITLMILKKSVGVELKYIWDLNYFLLHLLKKMMVKKYLILKNITSTNIVNLIMN